MPQSGGPPQLFSSSGVDRMDKNGASCGLREVEGAIPSPPVPLKVRGFFVDGWAGCAFPYDALRAVQADAPEKRFAVHLGNPEPIKSVAGSVERLKSNPAQTSQRESGQSVCLWPAERTPNAGQPSFPVRSAKASPHPVMGELSGPAETRTGLPRLPANTLRFLLPHRKSGP